MTSAFAETTVLCSVFMCARFAMVFPWCFRGQQQQVYPQALKRDVRPVVLETQAKLVFCIYRQNLPHKQACETVVDCMHHILTACAMSCERYFPSSL